MTTLLPAAACLLTLLTPPPGGDEGEKSRLTLTPAVATSKVRGFGDYDALDEAVVTKDDKLQLYYEVEGFAHDKDKKTGEYRIHLVQDAKIRRRGQKAVIQAKEKFVDYDARGKELWASVYMTNVLSLKRLSPGEYDLEIILRDEIGKGPPASQVFPFRVKAVEEAEDSGKDGDKKEQAPDPPPKKKDAIAAIARVGPRPAPRNGDDRGDYRPATGFAALANRLRADGPAFIISSW